jgi:hypothetical protein
MTEQSKADSKDLKLLESSVALLENLTAKNMAVKYKSGYLVNVTLELSKPQASK